MRFGKIGRLMGDCHYNKIILLLYLTGRKSKTEIYNRISTNPRMPQKLAFLEEEGYISVVREGTLERPRNMVDLTPLGIVLARGLCELEASVGGDAFAYSEAGREDVTGGEIRW